MVPYFGISFGTADDGQTGVVSRPMLSRRCSRRARYAFPSLSICVLEHRSLRSSFPFAPRCVHEIPAGQQHTHDDYRTRSSPSSPWRLPSSLAFFPWPSQMGSAWTVECAYIHSSFDISGKYSFSTAILCSAGSSRGTKSMECRTFY
jgi:hypothetical protein